MNSFQIIDVTDPPPGNCANTKAYIADVAGFGILVYDSATDSSWRVQNSTFQIITGVDLEGVYLKTKNLSFLSHTSETSAALRIIAG